MTNSKLNLLEKREQQLNEILSEGRFLGKIQLEEKLWERHIFNGTLYYIHTATDPSYQHISLRTSVCINATEVNLETDLFNHSVTAEMYFKQLLTKFASNRAKTLLEISYSDLEKTLKENAIDVLIALELYLEEGSLDEYLTVTLILKYLGLYDSTVEKLIQQTSEIVMHGILGVKNSEGNEKNE